MGRGTGPWARKFTRGELPVPAVRQATDYTCGPACMSAVLKMFGKEHPEAKVSKIAGATKQDGTTIDQMMDAAARLGLRAQLKIDMTLDEVAEAIDAGRAVIVPIQAWGEKRDYSKEWQDGHYVVPVAFEGNTVVFEDPSMDNARATLTREDFEDRWHDQDDGNRYEHAGIVLSGGLIKTDARAGSNTRKPMG